MQKIEWLGSQLDLEVIRKAFTQNKITYFYGKAFLVFQDGHTQQL